MIELSKHKIYFQGNEVGRYWKKDKGGWGFEIYGCYYTSTKGISNCGQSAYPARTLNELKMYARIVLQIKELISE